MKEKILRSIFFLSFVSYLIIPGQLLFGQQIVNGVHVQGIERLLNNILALQNYIFYVPIIPASLTFQMCYSFRKKPKIMTMCSFIPCVFIVLLGFLRAIFGGCLFWGGVSYGWEGFKIGISEGLICYNIFLPLLPACFVFQVIQIIRKIFHFIKNKKSPPSACN